MQSVCFEKETLSLVLTTIIQRKTDISTHTHQYEMYYILFHFSGLLWDGFGNIVNFMCL